MRGLIALLIVLLAVPAAAQQADPKVDAYRQMLMRAQDEFATVAAQAAGLQAQVQALTKQLEDARKETKAP